MVVHSLPHRGPAMPIPSTSVPPARFGPFEVDFRAGELLKNGRRIRLQDQPLQVLAMLLEHPGNVVTRDEFRQKLWPNDTFVDFDHGLNNAINRLRDALTTRLAQMRGMRVISRTSAMRFKGAKKALPEIAKELHVDAVVEGSVSRSDDVMHVNAQLIYAPGDRHIWARSYEGVQANLPTIESEIANDVAHKIAVAMTPDSSRLLSMTISVNPRAYDLYLRAEPDYGIETREAN